MSSSALVRNSARLIVLKPSRAISSCVTGRLSSSTSIHQGLFLSSYSKVTSTASLSLFHTSCQKQDVFTIQDEQDFKEKVMKNKKPVIVEFHATWCGPCKLLMPRMEKAMVLLGPVVDMAKVDIDEHPDIAMEFNVGAVPSVLAIKDGKVVDKFVGLKEDDQIGTFIESCLKK